MISAKSVALLLALTSVSEAFVQTGKASFLTRQHVHSNAVAPLNLLGRLFKLDETPVTKPAPEPDITEEEVEGLFVLWNQALATGDSRLVAARYASDAVLLPTVSDTPRTDYESIKDYFDNFLKRKPQGKILESYIRTGKGWAKDR